MRNQTAPDMPAPPVRAPKGGVPLHLAALSDGGADPDAAHDDAGMEWWYVNLHLVTGAGEPLSVFAAFFRIGERDDEGGVSYSHTLAAAWSEPRTRRYTPLSCVDDANLTLIRKVLHHDRAYAPRLREALRHLVSADRPPLPDLPLEGEPAVRAVPFAVDYGPQGSLGRDPRGRYRLRLRHPGRPFALDCRLTPVRPAAWQGGDGTVAGLGESGEGMRYYSVTRLEAEGTVTVDGAAHTIASGSAWYDHEWGLDPISPERGYTHDEPEWDWCGLHLDDGQDLSVSSWRRSDRRSATGRTVDRTSLLVSPDGAAGTLDDWRFEPLERWTSLATCNTYPVAWRLTAPSHGVDLELTAAFAEQEVRTITVHRGFWEGRVEVSGRAGGRPVTGRGFVEVKPAQVLPRIDPLMDTIGAETRAQVALLYPAAASPSTTESLLGPIAPDLLAVLPHESLHRALMAPVGHTVGGIGKSWRSFALVAVLEALGVSSDPYRPLLAAVELLHTGSLMVDDVQDAAVLRRGRPAAHTVYGEATALNAGTAAYFVFDRVLRALVLSDADRLRTYEILCAMLRCAHAGQGLDLTRDWADGPGPDPALLGERVLAVHRLKTALPVRALAEIGAALGKAGPAQEAALCDYFEALGLGYQIADDVWDLKGHRAAAGELRKEPGEDIRNGRVTYPLVCALELLPGPDARWLWERVRGRPQDRAEIHACVRAITGCGALELALSRAEERLDRAWEVLEPLLPPYPVVALLRSLGFYAVTRDAELNG
ncbi:polyprenyl synthetase family protein [Streptomyces nitrosporeus]|nr:polyprenyl synthetase family protein [Streptomyces nitrosporeus]GGY99192.1 hypothetical protein GCM10010327_32270 [Streptomyces nitrosporeus]